MTLEELEEKGALPAQLLERKTFIQAEILRSAEEEELYWHKPSNSTWLLKGDNNIDYFHRIANGKKRKNAIFSLQHGENTIEGEKEILVHATNYYKDLFGPSDSPKMKMDPQSWGEDEKLSQEDNEKLSADFSKLEIKNAIFSMEQNMAPGPTTCRWNFTKNAGR